MFEILKNKCFHKEKSFIVNCTQLGHTFFQNTFFIRLHRKNNLFELMLNSYFTDPGFFFIIISFFVYYALSKFKMSREFVFFRNQEKYQFLIDLTWNIRYIGLLRFVNTLQPFSFQCKK
jgi:hypothetical protein